MNEWDGVLRALADDPADYEREGGMVLFTRHGDEHEIVLKEIPTAGLCVEAAGGLLPIATYVQRDILGLGRLARQIVTIYERPSKARLVPFVEGPATAEFGTRQEEWPRASVELRRYLQEAEPGTTRLVELMAPAGRGKTMLLETVARELAVQYQPAPYPIPLLLKVDLLGRYVGTIDDAIAGSLNNEYFFPGLSQKDVTLAVRLRWLVLALDGFDELVARVGSRDAFLRITELLEQLEGQGTVILSARESFFELYQISSAIRTYLQPKRGSYSTFVVRLNRWSHAQGVEVFQKLESQNPREDFEQLASAFENDAELIYHPFFLTRLAQLWMQGERFANAVGQTSRLARTRYVIETFVDREAREKWIDRDGNPLVPTVAHIHLLAGVAEEMWRSGAFALDSEELRLAAQLGAAHLGLSGSIMDGALERLPTHAALATKDRKGTAFLHDRFLHYFLGVRVVHLLHEFDAAALRHLLAARELSPDVAEWIVWGWQATAGTLSRATRALQTTLADSADSVLRANVSDLTARLCDRQENAGVELRCLEFVGESCKMRRFDLVRFENCQFWHADLSGSCFSQCVFDGCEFGDVLIDTDTSFRGSRFVNVSVASVQCEGDEFYAPTDIRRVFEDRGVAFEPSEQSLEEPTSVVRPVDRERFRVITVFVRASSKTLDVAVEEVSEHLPPRAVRDVLRVGLETEVLKTVQKTTSGPRKTFVRFAVDRQRLTEGIRGPVGDARIDEFWTRLERKD